VILDLYLPGRGFRAVLNGCFNPSVSALATERVVRSHGIDLFVRERGDGFPLLMLNGLGSNVDTWGYAEERLSGVARTIALDSPGSGRSSTPLWPLSIAMLARAAADVLDELGRGRVDVLGFSLGGLIAQQLARQQPARVRRMALVGTTCGWGSMPGEPAALTLLSMPLRYHSRVLYDRTSCLLSPADRELLGRVDGVSKSRLDHPPSLVGYAAQLWAGATWSSLSWLPSLQVPVLVVHGGGDRLVPAANAVQLARLLPESRLHILPGEGHLLVVDPDGGAIPLLEEFFAAPNVAESRAWSTGRVVDDDETVETAFELARGTQPYRAMSGAYRWFVRHASSFAAAT
jgi:pimeloyl-ACP methyl ester carboxylesterase